MARLNKVLLATFCGALIAAGVILFSPGVPRLLRGPSATVEAASEAQSGRIRFAVLGDSDSQSYHDTLMLGDPGARGGPWRATTWQWTEVLARLRGDQIDLGEWGAWGTGKYRAYFDEAFGRLARTPRKYDYRYNFAISGSICSQLMGHPLRQAIRLVDLMDTEPQAWRGGIVLIRIGVNDIGAHDVLDELSRDRNASRPTALINACVGEIGKAVALIRMRHPDTNVVLVGVLNNADQSVDWQSASEIANIDAGMDRFDNGLRKLAAADRHVYFLDDRAWFESLWGKRDEQGRPLYKTVHLSPGWAITNTSGDDPHHAVLSDGHAGVVWNTLWTQHLVASLDAAFGLHLKPITDGEVTGFLKQSFAVRAQSDLSPLTTSAK
ncbi:SGNH/GDSL hydrolase family protein [Paraburkholderia dinghuensis]|uniref:SGNH/GDSL hydrolase family protein n=1 Tax=Paraburkholderia dinghuensis TaxID=2305225 RepID=A0A3N6PW89_9BURK|nr:SGNH/GDSL hydrolase family protein [Paraburkholderia dinghuensis]RQH04136.1 SGNH/GDSL hydrolase family protein [Paraburkholderia dinghuensis]